MSIDERLRLSIHTQLTELLGSDEADALIEHIMPVPWRDVATHDDLRVTTAELRGEMTQLGSELRGEISEVRGEVSELRGEVSELRGEMTELRADLRGEMADLRTELTERFAGLQVDVRQSIVAQTRWLTGYMTAMVAIALTAARTLF